MGGWGGGEGFVVDDLVTSLYVQLFTSCGQLETSLWRLEDLL